MWQLSLPRPFVRTMAAVSLVFALTSAVYWLCVYGFVGDKGFPLDDSYIHLRFAQNIAEDGVMAFNRGVPSSGSTAAGYPMLLALGFKFIGNWYLTNYALGIVATLAICAFVFRTIHDWTQRSDVAGLGALVCLLMHPTIIQAYTGMESAVHAAVFMAGLYCYGRERLRVVASLLFAVSVWVRPEMVLMLPFMIFEWFVSPNRQRPRASAIALHGLVWLFVIASWIYFNFHQDGHLLPSTFSAKSVGKYGGILPLQWLVGLPAALKDHDILSVVRALVVWPLVLGLSLLLAFVLACAPGLKRCYRARSAAWAAGPGPRLALITLVLFPLVRGIIDPVGLVPFQFQRYYAHLTPIFACLVALAIAQAGDEPASLFKRSRAVVIAAAASLLWSVPWTVISVSNINNMQVKMVERLRQHPGKGLIATNDIGAIAFLTDRPVLDLIGLVEPKLVEHRARGGTTLDYLKQRKPEWIVVFPNWFPDFANSPNFKAVETVSLDFNITCPSSTMIAYRINEQPIATMHHP